MFDSIKSRLLRCWGAASSGGRGRYRPDVCPVPAADQAQGSPEEPRDVE